MEFPVSRSYVLARAVALWVTLIAFLASAALMASLAPPSLLRFATLTSLCLACLLACLQLFRCTRRIRRTDVRIVLDDDSISLPRLMCGSSKRYRMEDVSASTLHRSMNGEEWLTISTRIGLFIVERRLFQSNHSFDRFCAALNREGDNPVKRPHAMRFPILSLLLAAVFLISYYLTLILSAQDTTVASPIASGALDIDDVRSGEYYRLIATLFLHANPLHLYANCSLLLLIGFVWEESIGSWRFGAVFVLCGLLSSLAAVFGSPYDTVVGPSGAIYGLLGYGLIMQFRFHALSERPLLRSPLIPLVFLCGAIIDSSLAYWTSAAIDHVTHASGFVAGCLLAFLSVCMNKPVARRARDP